LATTFFPAAARSSLALARALGNSEARLEARSACFLASPGSCWLKSLVASWAALILSASSFASAAVAAAGSKDLKIAGSETSLRPDLSLAASGVVKREEFLSGVTASPVLSVN